MENLYKNINTYIFVSPHLDDAIFSCGGLINKLHNDGKKIIVINVFTKASPAPYTISIKKFLKSCGYNDADELYLDRIKEDRKVLKNINAKIINLGFVDALWRRKNTNWKIPELNYIYPIFRISIAKGLISKHDGVLINNIKEELDKHIINNDKTLILCPSGIGKHTDHLIVRNIVSKNYKRVAYWEDYPYSETKSIDQKFISNEKLIKKNLSFNSKDKNNLVNGYKSQLNAIFGKNLANVKGNEAYYFRKNENSFPYKLGQFTFVSTYMEKEQEGTYSLAIYKSKKGKQVFVKRWKGKKKDISYRWLKNEIEVYKILNNQNVRSRVRIPKLIRVINQKKNLFMIIEFIKNQSIENQTVDKKVKSYESVLSFFKSIKIDDLKNKIANRNPLFWLAISPLASLKAIFNYPKYSHLIIKNLFEVISNSRYLLSRKERAFVHRDLNDFNIFNSPPENIVLDFELSCIADPILDIAIVLLKFSNNKKFIDKFKNLSSVKQLLQNSDTKKAINSYIIIFAIYDLNFKKGIHDLDLKILSKK